MRGYGWRRKTGKKKRGEARRVSDTRKGRKVVRGSGLSKEKKTKEGKENQGRKRKGVAAKEPEKGGNNRKNSKAESKKEKEKRLRG